MGAKVEIAEWRRSPWFLETQLGWLMLRSLLFWEVVGRIITLFPKAESLGFLLLCRLQCCFYHLPRASCQLLWEALFRFKAGVEGRWSDSGSFFPESILFLRLSGSLCTDRSLFPGQKNWRQALDICQFLITCLTLYTLFSWNLFRPCLFLERLWDLFQNKVYLQ